MSTLQYVGRAPDSDSIVVPKSYADTLNNTLTVTTGTVTTLLNTQLTTNPPTIQSYVDTANTTVAQQAALTSALASYLPAARLNAANGIAGLNSAGNVISSQVPSTGLITDRVTQCYSVGMPSTLTNVLGGTLTGTSNAIGQLLFSATTTVTSTNSTGTGTLQLASIVIPDPGWPWRPLPFGWVLGDSSGGTAPATRMTGTGNYGKLLVIPPVGVSSTIYGLGICGGSYYTNISRVLPYAGGNQTPNTVPAITGSLELDLWGSCWSGNSYTFYPNNFVFFVLVVPAI